MTKEEILRKRNLELVQENNELKNKLATQEINLKHAQKMIDDVNAIQTDLLNALEQAYEFRDKYQALLKELQGFKKTVKGRNAIERWAFDLKKK